MSWIDRINAAIVRRIHGKVALQADDQGVEVSGQRLPYSRLQRAVAYRHPSNVGDDLTVALDFGEGQIVLVTENDEAWGTVLSALDRHPRRQRSSREWRLALIAATPTERIELLS